MFPRSQKRRPQFLQIRHGFDQDQVGVLSRFHGVRKGVVCPPERKVAHRFEDPPERPDVQRYKFIARLLPREPYARADQLVGKFARAGFDFVCAEGVRRNHVCPRRGIFAVDFCNQFRGAQVQFFGNGSRFSARFALQYGAERAVEHDDAVPDKFSEIHGSSVQFPFSSRRMGAMLSVMRRAT